MRAAGALRLGIFCALADYQPLRMNSLRSDKCFTAEAARKKSSKPRETRPAPPPALRLVARNLEGTRLYGGRGSG